MKFLILLSTCILLGVFGQLAMKRGMNTIGSIGLGDILSNKIFSILFQKYVFTGIILYIIGNLVWLVILSQAELSFVYPLISIGYILTAVLSWLFFGENLTLFRILGILLICGGVYLIVLNIGTG